MLCIVLYYIVAYYIVQYDISYVILRIIHSCWLLESIVGETAVISPHM